MRSVSYVSECEERDRSISLRVPCMYATFQTVMRGEAKSGQKMHVDSDYDIKTQGKHGEVPLVHMHPS